MTTTLTLTQGVYIGGVLQAAGTSITVNDSLAGALISENKAMRPPNFGVDFNGNENNLKQVADNCSVEAFYYRYAANTGSVITPIRQVQSRSVHRIFYSVDNLQVEFSNEVIDVTTLNTGIDVSLKAALTFNGVTYPLTFSGNRSVNLPGGTFILSDPLKINIPENSRIFISQIRAVTNGSVTGFVLSPRSTAKMNTTSTEFDALEIASTVNGLTDKVDTPATILNNNGITINTVTNGAILLPSAIVSVLPYTKTNANLLIGDSIVAGSSDIVDSTAGGYGMLSRIVGKKYPYINIGLFGASSWQFAGISNNFLLGSRPPGIVTARLANYCANVIAEFGCNQLRGGGTAVSVFGDHRVFMDNIDYITGKKLNYVWTTLTPRTTSTDSWATTANQTDDYTSLAEYAAYNAIVRAGTYTGFTGRNLYGYIDLGGILESALDSNRWAAANLTAADGIHPSALGFKRLELNAKVYIPGY
jgi:hypothetical protein